MTVLAVLAVLVLLPLAGLAVLRARDMRDDRREWRRLAAGAPVSAPPFRAEMVASLPDPARRFFIYAIAEGAPLAPVAEIRMSGRFSLGTKDAPRYLPMTARQILAAPEGFVWSARMRGGLTVTGSDSGGWTRFRLMGLIPVARICGDADHALSAFGRMAAEAVFWTPQAVLPAPGIDWAEVNETTARVTIRQGDLAQAVDLTVDAAGRPLRIAFDRWSDANPEKRYRRQPFGGFLSDFRRVNGISIPHHVEAGNMFGTAEYFPFFIADLDEVRFLPTTPAAASPR